MNIDQAPAKVTPIHDVSKELGAHFIESAGWRVPGRYGNLEEEEAAARQSVALADVSASGKITVEGRSAGSLLQMAWAVSELAIGQGEKQGSRLVYRLRDDQYFVHLEPGAEGPAIMKLHGAANENGKLVAISDLTHGLAELRLIGPRSGELLARLCGLDFHPSQFPDLTAKHSGVAKTRQLVVRRDVEVGDGEPIPAYSLVGTPSLAVYLWQTIREAGNDLELRPIGQLALNRLSPGD